LTVLVDSWAWVEYWSGGSHADQVALHIEGNENAMLSTINLAEIYHWILLHYDEKAAEEKDDHDTEKVLHYSCGRRDRHRSGEDQA